MNALVSRLMRSSSTARTRPTARTLKAAVATRAPSMTRSSMRAFSSVSSSEVNKFSDMHQEWWDPKKNPLIYMNAIRVQYIRTMVERELSRYNQGHLPFQDLTAVDIGCGGGLLSESLARLGGQVTGVDPSASLIHAAQQHAANDPRTRNITYCNATAEELVASEQQDQFDIVCLLEVVEHATDVPSLLEAAAALLTPQGLLFVSTLNRTPKSHLTAIVGAEYLAGYLPVGTHDWNQFISPAEMEAIMKQTVGLEQVDVTGMVLTSPPFRGSWNWKLDPADTDVNWIGTYRRPI